MQTRRCKPVFSKRQGGHESLVMEIKWYETKWTSACVQILTPPPWSVAPGTTCCTRKGRRCVSIIWYHCLVSYHLRAYRSTIYALAFCAARATFCIFWYHRLVLYDLRAYLSTICALACVLHVHPSACSEIIVWCRIQFVLVCIIFAGSLLFFACALLYCMVWHH